MNVYVLKLNPEANLIDQWDFGIVKWLLGNSHINIADKLPNLNRAVVCIAARHHAGYEDTINNQLQNVDRAILVLCGDEEAEFAVEKIDHHNIEIWIQNPHQGKHDEYNRIGTGYPTHLTSKIPAYTGKSRTMYFGGQMTHKTRRELVDVMQDMYMQDETILCLPTRGFTQGESPEDYYKHMSEAKIAPAPSGAVIPDSFRLFEALECMAIPLADENSPTGYKQGYWDWLFGEITPFPKINQWDRLFGLVPELLEDYPRNLHEITAWYIQWKYRTKDRIEEQYNA